jgi:hypothetical protein
MGLQIIIRKSNSYGKSRAEQESNLRKDGFKSMPDESFDRTKFLAKKTGYKGFVPQGSIKDFTDNLEG